MSRSNALAFALGAILAAAITAVGCSLVGIGHRGAPFGTDFDDGSLLHWLTAGKARTLPPNAVVVDHVPPDACLAFYGPGPCREHGSTIVGSTNAVAGPPPASGRRAVR